MPYCIQCGNQVGAGDAYCGKCGGRQPVEPVRKAEPLSGLSPRTASILCYIPWAGWIMAIVILAADRFRANRAVRFHAFQGLYLFVVWLIDDWVLAPVFRTIPHVHIEGLVHAILIGIAIFMMVKASQGEAYSLPVIGELAERSVAEH